MYKYHQYLVGLPQDTPLSTLSKRLRQISSPYCLLSTVQDQRKVTVTGCEQLMDAKSARLFE